jgi:hypothetical protein
MAEMNTHECVRKHVTARLAWVGLLLYVVVVDGILVRFEQDTMSTEARRHPVATGITAGTITAHLLYELAADPFRLVGGVAKRALVR